MDARDTEEADVEALQREVDDVIKEEMKRRRKRPRGACARRLLLMPPQRRTPTCARLPTLYKRRRPRHL